MDKAELLERLVAAKEHADRTMAIAEAQRRLVSALAALGRDTTAAERILERLEKAQTDDLSQLSAILNALEDYPS